jgi:DNA-directed RNA polymerase specialized sigma24 family protein
MSDHVLAEALQARDPTALAALYDAYADPLYAYCWFRLGNHAAAQQALRDTFIGAEAHIGRLRDRGRLRLWLYALARLECARRMPYGGPRPDVPIASHDQEDVDLRITAWRAVAALPPLSRDVMELRVRHRLKVPELAAVLGVPEPEVKALLLQAGIELDAALTAEVLAHEGPYDCPGRAAILRDRRPELTADLRVRLLRHALDCDRCGAHRSRTVSATKVYGVLPTVRPPEALRLRMLNCFLDPDFVGYRFFVAARVGRFGRSGFPVQLETRLQRRRVQTGRDGGTGALRHPALLGTAAGLVVAVVGLSLVPLFARPGDRTVRTAPSHAAPGPPGGPVRSGPVAPPIAAPPPVGQDFAVISPMPLMFSLGSRRSGPSPLVAPVPPPIGPEPPGSGEPRPGPGGPRPGTPTPRPTQPSPTPAPPVEPTPTAPPSSPPPSSPPPSSPPPSSPPPGTAAPGSPPPPHDPAPGPSAMGG